MRKLYNQLMNAEPARLINGSAAILVILVGVAAYFIPQFSDVAGTVISGAIVAIAAELTRSKVYAPKTVDAIKKDANAPL